MVTEQKEEVGENWGISNTKYSERFIRSPYY